MKWKSSPLPVVALLVGSSDAAFPLRAQSADPGWPRVFQQGHNQLTVYQPQVDYWNGFTNMHFRCAIALKGVTKQEKFGVAEIDAITVVDQTARIVALVPTQREVRFPNCSDSELATLRRAADELRPPGQATTLSLDRVIAYLSPAEHATQHPVEVNLDPPAIFYSRQPAILVMMLGEPQFKPVETNRMDLMFALNTNWDLFYDTVGQHYYLLNENNWLTAPDVKGPWTPAQALPPSLSTLPANDNWADVRQNIPGKRAKAAPIVFVSTQPAELITTKGDPTYGPIKGTQLMRVLDTESVLFMNMGDGKFYFLVAGRWFRASSLDGPWSAASRDLPADFSRIPDGDPAAFVKACVPGTREANDAVLLASIPTTTTVYTTNATVHVVYDGTPQFRTIETTTIQYAVNTPYQVFLVKGKYYCCDAGIWFISSSSLGPWAFCTSVPQVIYAIPPSSPYHNVTYVVVQSSTPTTVVYTQTSGYSGEYVAATGVLMFGAGMLVGAAIANNNRYYYYPPYPCYYSYGCSATYHYGYGGYYYQGAAAYGPYGGAGYTTAYNPSTGTYSRGAYAYGPYGSASAQSTYNPYTGAYSRSAQVNTAYGSAGRSAGYNPTTGTYAAGGYRSSAYGTAAAGRSYNPYTGTSTAGASASTAYGSASRGAAYDSQTGARAAGGQVSTASGSAGRAAGYNPTTGNAAVGGYSSSQYGSAAGVRTSQGTGAASWNTANSQGAVAKSQSGDVYASNGDTVYKKDSSGNWSQNTGSGWESTTKPQPQTSTSTAGSTSSSSKQAQAQSQASSRQQQASTSSSTKAQNSSSASTSWSQNKASMESQAQSRSWGNQQHQSAQSWQSSSASGGSRSRSGKSR
jgi:hypothetical protein